MSASLRVLTSPGSTGTDGNPYVDLLVRGVRDAGVEVLAFDRRGLLGHPHVVHVHWPAALVRWGSPVVAPLDVAKVLVLLAFARLRGARLVWTAHDLRPHELLRPRLFAVYFALFTRMVDLWISLTGAGARQLERRYPSLRRRPHRVIAHGSYRGAYAGRPDRAAAEAALGLAAATGPSYLLLGQLRRYKNAVPLALAFDDSREPGERLLVAGEVRGDRALADELRAAAAGADGAIVLRPERIDAAAVPAWHAAADVVVLPYDERSALNSGALLLALSLDVPVVAADSPVNRELRDVVGGEWLRLFTGGAADALAAARAVATDPPDGRPDLDGFAWPAIVERTVAAYREASGSRA